MRVAAVVARGFRNLNGRFPVAAPLAVLVGENNAGKSNVIDACRLLFEPEAGPRSRRWITAEDFEHDDTGARLADTFTLEAELVDLSEAQQARMVTCLAPSLGPGCARLRMEARLRADGRVDTEWLGGDADHPDLERWAREAVTFTYLHPLRDAANDLRPGRDNRLVALLGSLAPDDHADRVAIEQIAQDANDALAKVGALQDAKTRIQDRLDGLTGRGTMSQQTDLAFAEPQFDRVVAALRSLAGSVSPLEIGENGLGYNNLLYMAVLLSALAEETDAELRLLLVEEPEAHLHPQLQDLLMRYLESEGQDGTQVIVTSHSPNFASAARVERLTVMAREHRDAPVVARTPATFGLTDIQLAHLRRFLDVTKASLLFARGVILVEGVAEQLLVPAIATAMGRPLSRSGVAVINIGGVAFPPFAELFGPDKLPYRCAIVSDADPPDQDDDQKGADPGLSPRASALKDREGDNLLVRLVTNTLEWDLVAAGNWDLAVQALKPIKPRVAPALASFYAEEEPTKRADALLAKVKDVKGRFAQELVALIAGGAQVTVPAYLAEAIEWVTADQDPPHSAMTTVAADPLREPGFLTEHQLRAVEAEGNIFLTACPGSGKTRSAGVRVARLAEDGLRVAACSYTNVGVEQIRRVLSHDLRRTLDARHYTGTLHGFLLRYVLYPFGHLVTGSTGSLRLVGDEAIAQDVVFNNDPKTRLSLSRFRFRPHGSLIVRSVPAKFRFDHEQATSLGQSAALWHKRRIAKAGVVSFDDAMYWSLCVLERHPDLARAVAGRFDELLVDEAQDTSELQLACLERLSRTGALQSLFLVGDLEQSISAYTGASRVGCEALATTRDLAPMNFTENHRASQRLCDIAVHFCARSAPDVAVGPDRDCPIEPELVLYPVADPTAAVSRFRERVEELGEKVAEAAVLARRNDLCHELNGTTTTVEVKPRPLAIGRAVAAFQGGGTVGRRQLEAIDRIIAYTAWDVTDIALLDDHTRWATRRATMALLADAPELDLDLRAFIRGCAAVLRGVVDELTDDPRHKAGQVLASASAQEGHRAGDVLVAVTHELRAQTVHDIKGESRPSVHVVVDRLRSRKHGAQGALWSRPLVGQEVDESDAEELRIAFVALTRARRYCAVALPDNSTHEVISAFESAGFRRR